MSQHYDPNRSINHPDLLEAFLKAPLTGDLIECPGVGQVGVEKFHQSGIFTSFQLMAKMMSFIGEDFKMNRAAAPLGFFNWMTEIGAPPAYRASVIEAMCRRIEISFGLNLDMDSIVAGHKTHEAEAVAASQPEAHSQTANSQT